MRPCPALLPLLLLVTMATSHPADPVFDRVIVAGDSLSDIGNVWEESDHSWPLSYYQEGRFSNGLVWAEYLSQALGASLVNLAYGGATSSNQLVHGYSGPDSEIPVPGAVQQIIDFFAGTPDIDHSLFVVFAGLNDYYFDPDVEPSDSVANILSAMKTIFDNGGTNFLIPRLPMLGNVPHYIDTPQRSKLNAACTLHNRLLTEAVVNFQKYREGAQVFLWYADYLFEAAHRSPAMFDLKDSTNSCIQYDANSTAIFCEDPDEFLFWDTFHPTTKFHSVMGSYAADLIDSALSVADTQPDGFAYNAASQAGASLSTLLLSVLLLTVARDHLV